MSITARVSLKGRATKPHPQWRAAQPSSNPFPQVSTASSTFASHSATIYLDGPNTDYRSDAQRHSVQERPTAIIHACHTKTTSPQPTMTTMSPCFSTSLPNKPPRGSQLGSTPSGHVAACPTGQNNGATPSPELPCGDEAEEKLCTGGEIHPRNDDGFCPLRPCGLGEWKGNGH